MPVYSMSSFHPLQSDDMSNLSIADVDDLEDESTGDTGIEEEAHVKVSAIPNR